MAKNKPNIPYVDNVDPYINLETGAYIYKNPKSVTITKNGNYNVTLLNSIDVDVESEPPTLIEKTITKNGTYIATDDEADGYSSVNVEVPNTYTNEDEGKVVDNGELVSQTAYATEITENNTYDTTLYNSITVNVSSSSSIVAICTFNFINHQFLLEDESGTIANNAFSECDELTSITIPNSVTSIGSSAFFSCVTLTSITVPSSVTSIGNSVFAQCSSLGTVTFEANSSLESIGSFVFEACHSLTSITIPNSVTSIGSSAFDYCRELTLITFESTTPPALDGDLGIPTTCSIRVPQGTLSAYTSAQYYPDPSEYIYEEY